MFAPPFLKQYWPKTSLVIAMSPIGQAIALPNIILFGQGLEERARTSEKTMMTSTTYGTMMNVANVDLPNVYGDAQPIISFVL